MYNWLDKIIDEQAAYYGRTPAQHERAMREAAQAQELIEQQGDGPTADN